MTALAVIREQLAAIGYADDALLAEYAFADVMAADGGTRSVALAAFTQTPPSYRTAAFGVIQSASDVSDLGPYRAL